MCISWACRAGGWRSGSRQVRRSNWRRMGDPRRSRSGRRPCATAHVSGSRADTSSPCWAGSASASLSASGVTWVWPSSAWSTTARSIKTARSSSKRCPQAPPRHTPPAPHASHSRRGPWRASVGSRCNFKLYCVISGVGPAWCSKKNQISAVCFILILKICLFCALITCATVLKHQIK